MKIEPGDKVRFWDAKRQRIRQGTAVRVGSERLTVFMGTRYGDRFVWMSEVRAVASWREICPRGR